VVQFTDTNKLSAYPLLFISQECKFETAAAEGTHFNLLNNIYIQDYVEPGHLDGAHVPSQALGWCA